MAGGAQAFLGIVGSPVFPAGYALQLVAHQLVQVILQ